MWYLDHKEGWVPKYLSFQTLLLEKILENPLGSKEIKPVNPKGNKPWIFIRRTDAETEASILWPLDAKIWLIGKDHDTGKDWGQEEKWVTKDEMTGWHHWLSGHEFEETPLMVKDRESWSVAFHGITKSWDWATEQQQQIFHCIYPSPIFLPAKSSWTEEPWYSPWGPKTVRYDLVTKQQNKALRVSLVAQW